MPDDKNRNVEELQDNYDTLNEKGYAVIDTDYDIIDDSGLIDTKRFATFSDLYAAVKKDPDMKMYKRNYFNSLRFCLFSQTVNDFL